MTQKRDRRWVLAAVFCFALGLRCYHLFAPLLDTHSWRQADTAAIARNFTASGYHFAFPQVDWGGATAGFVESEFPLYTGMLALLYAMFGTHEWLGRLLSACASAAVPLVLYKLVRENGHEQRAALYAALAYSVLPFAVYFGRAVMPDSLMVLAAALAIWTFQRWLVEPRMSRFLPALVCGMLAPLAKTPNLVIVAVPIAALVLAHRPWLRWRNWRGMLGLVAYTAAFALPVLLWTRHAATLPEDSRLSFGVGEKLLDIGLLSDPQFYMLVAGWVANNVLTWAGIVFAAIGALACWRAKSGENKQRSYTVFAWLLGVAVFVCVGAAGVVGQDYYMLPLSAPAAWLIGIGVAALQTWVEPRRGRLGALVPFAAFTLIGMLSVLRIAPMYQTARFYGQLGQRIDQALPQGQRVGVIAPAVSEVLYYGNRKGWRLDPGVLVPGGLSSLGPDLGIRYVVITDPWLSERRELLEQELRAYKRVPVGPYALLLDLQQPGYTGEFAVTWETGAAVVAPFLHYWNMLGGSSELGFPISDTINRPDGELQYFERAVLQATADDVTFAPAGRWLFEARGRTPVLTVVAPTLRAAWQRFGGETGLGSAISPLENGIQFFENGALEQTDDGVRLGAVGRWLIE